MKTKLFTIQLIIFGYCQFVNAQLNLQIGYGAAYTNPKSNNEILALYNKENAWMSKTFNPVHYMHGLTVGARYSFDYCSVGLAWTNASHTQSTEGINPSTSTDYKMELFYRYQTYGLRLETAGTRFNLGASLDYSIFKIKDRLTGQKQKTGFLTDKGLGSHFYCNVNLPTWGNMGICIQPYYFVDWSGTDMLNLNTRLLKGAYSGNSFSKFHQIGVSLIFNNGPQSNYN